MDFHTSNPKPGDQIFFGTSISNSNHTGLVEKVDSSKVYTIEGNTSDQVARRTYAIGASNILGYGRPNYDAETGASTGGSSASNTPTASTTPSAAPASSTTEKTATCSAKRFDGSIAGTYKVTAASGLHIRNDSNLKDKAKATSLVVLPYGTKVQNYGYFNVESDGKWLYIQVVYNGVKYTGFSHADYLSKQ